MAFHGYSRLLPSEREPETSWLERSYPKEEIVPKTAVTLHVYSVSGSSTVKKVNRVLEPMQMGAFHAAVEVYGKEWSFGYTEEGTGVFCCNPRGCEAHVYLHSLAMGRTGLSQSAVLALIGSLARDWQGDDYDLLRCNCCHFSDELLRQLGVKPLPKQLLKLAGVGAGIVDVPAVLATLLGRLQVETSPAFNYAQEGAAQLRAKWAASSTAREQSSRSF
mmetsp:Transcript_20417/g.36601  ORF Transcript_20417/g.36601 Transcript_20417/m.36601 type:complete len:219 (+) Transcript_20417:92-748(+)